MKPAYAYTERPSLHGWRATFSDASGPIVSIWALTGTDAYRAASEALRRMTAREMRVKANGECE